MNQPMFQPTPEPVVLKTIESSRPSAHDARTAATSCPDFMDIRELLSDHPVRSHGFQEYMEELWAAKMAERAEADSGPTVRYSDYRAERAPDDLDA